MYFCFVCCIAVGVRARTCMCTGVLCDAPCALAQHRPVCDCHFCHVCLDAFGSQLQLEGWRSASYFPKLLAFLCVCVCVCARESVCVH